MKKINLLFHISSKPSRKYYKQFQHPNRIAPIHSKFYKISTSNILTWLKLRLAMSLLMSYAIFLTLAVEAKGGLRATISHNKF